MNNKLIITKGSHLYECDRTIIVGSEWVIENDLCNYICCAELSGIWIFDKIPTDSFLYSISRLRSPERHICKRGNNKRGVFMNLEGLWMGRECVTVFGENRVSTENIKRAYEAYWND